MEKIPYTITMFCMEPSRPAIVADAVARINAEELPVHIRLHAHESAVLQDADMHRTLAGHIASSDLVIASHVFTDDEAEPLATLIREHAPEHAVILGLSSAAPLMRLTRIGKFVLGRKQKEPETQSSGGLGRLKKILQGIMGDRDVTPYLKDMMTIAPKALRLIPSGKMRDLRSYLESYLYFVELSAANIRSMFLMIPDRYHHALKGRLTRTYTAPVVHPSEGIYHPSATGLFASRNAYLEWYNEHFPVTASVRGTIGLLLLRSNIILGETSQIDATIRAFESRGIRVIPAFSESFDYRIAIESMMRGSDTDTIDAIVSLTGFPLVGGHVRSDAPAAAAALERYGVPYFAPVSLVFQTEDEWKDSDYGLNPVQTALHIALPELDGAIEPMVTGGIVAAGDGKMKTMIDERTQKMIRRVDRWITLRKTPAADKRIALTVFAFPPNKGSVGTAAYLDVFRSAYNTLVRLKAEGYTIELPESPERMIHDIVHGEDVNVLQANAELNVAATLSVAEYRRLAPEASARVAEFWGPPPGALNTDGTRLQIFGYRYGNVFVGVQPSFGFEGDPMRLLFAKGATPHHGFLAYYTWIEHVFGADAHLHFGTHGSLEFMPGKQAGLSGTCWPDVLTGDLPNAYLYSINNPSEGTIAKRRALATLVGYMTPPLENAGLYRELGELKSLVLDYYTVPPEHPQRKLTGEILIEKADQLHLDKDVRLPVGTDDVERFVGQLHAHLNEIESRLIPSGLHIVGNTPAPNELADLLLAVSEYDRPEHNVRSLTSLIAESHGNGGYHELYKQAESGDQQAMEQYTAIRRQARSMIDDVLAGNRQRIPSRYRTALRYLREVSERAREERELDSLATVLRGGYIPPAVGADPVRNPEALPSGRNVHALDPAAVPTEAALRNAKRVVDLMLQKNYEETGRYPEHIGMVLWGLDNIKTHGEAIAQVFALIGVEPERNSIGRVSRIKVIPLQELGRPRIDVTVQASGIFRDLFGLQIELLDTAIRTVAMLDEPEEHNYVRRNVRRIADLLSMNESEAATRIFSNAAGAYGANVDYMVGMSQWETREELAEVFTRRKSFAYGKGATAHESRKLFEALAENIDTTFQNLDSSEVGITDVDHYFEYLGGLTSVVERASGQRPTVLVADTTTARGKVRTLPATIRLEARTKLLNPKWSEGMLRHGYQGVEEIRKRLDYTFGFSATADAVEEWVYDETYRRYIADEAIRERMQHLNPYALSGMVHRLQEAIRRNFWQATTEQREHLQELSDLLEDVMEGVR